MDYSVYQSDVLQNLLNSYWNNQQEAPDQTEEATEPVDNQTEEGDENTDNELQSKYDDVVSQNEALQRQLDDYDFQGNNSNDLTFLNSLFEDNAGHAPTNFSEEANIYRNGDTPVVTNTDLAWLKTKDKTVNLTNLDQTIGGYLNTLPDQYKQSLVATSGNDADVHVPNSKHYKNEAVDLRYNQDIYNYIQNDPNLKNLGLKVLPPNHGTAPHIHIEKKQYGGKSKIKIMEDGGGDDKLKKLFANNKPNYGDTIAGIRSTDIQNKNNQPRGIPDFHTSDLSLMDEALLNVTGTMSTVEKGKKLYNQLAAYTRERLKNGSNNMSPDEINLRNRAANAVDFNYPQSIGDIKEIVNRIDKGEKVQPFMYEGESDRVRHEMIQQYMGINNNHKYLQPSKYKPSNSTDPNATYYDFNDNLRNDIYKQNSFDDIVNVIKNNNDGKTSGTSKQTNLDKDYRRIKEDDNVLGQLGTYKLSLGKDENGDYVSYYDLWDLDAPILKDHNLDIDKVNYPFEVYGRLYKKDFPQKKYGGKYKIN